MKVLINNFFKTNILQDTKSQENMNNSYDYHQLWIFV